MRSSFNDQSNSNVDNGSEASKDPSFLAISGDPKRVAVSSDFFCAEDDQCSRHRCRGHLAECYA